MAGRVTRFALALLLALGLPAARAEVVAVALADGSSLRAHWFPVTGTAPRPVVVALHGCGGLYRRDGSTLDARYPDYVARFNRAGYHVLLPDSFGSRGITSICTTRAAERAIKVDTRRNDAAAAVRWAAAQPGVDPQRIALLGWSNGASTTLAAIDRTRSDGAAPLAAVVVLYPGCSSFLRKRFAIREPLLMLLGADDDWTPPGPCVELADRIRVQQPEAEIRVRVFEGSVHGFDGTGPVRLRRDVPNGIDPKGVHVGGNAAARTAALEEINTFLRLHLDR